MSDESIAWLDSLDITYDRAKAGMLIEANDWAVFRRELEARQSYAFSSDAALNQFLNEENLEYLQAVALVCASKDYFLTAREVWLANAADWEQRLGAGRIEWLKGRPSEWALLAEGRKFCAEWHGRLDALETELNTFLDDYEELFPTHSQVKVDEVMRQAGGVRNQLVGVLMELKRDLGRLEAESRRRPALLGVAVALLLVAGISWYFYFKEPPPKPPAGETPAEGDGSNPAPAGSANLR